MQAPYTETDLLMLNRAIAHINAPVDGDHIFSKKPAYIDQPQKIESVIQRTTYIMLGRMDSNVADRFKASHREGYSGPINYFSLALNIIRNYTEDLKSLAQYSALYAELKVK